MVVVIAALYYAPWGRKLQLAKSTRQVPNALTHLRLLLAPLFLILLVLGAFHHPLMWGALAIWLLAITTDHLDGLSSRAWGHVSDYGKYWDSVADKALTIPGLLGLILVHIMPFSPALGTTTYFASYLALWAVYAYRDYRVTVVRNRYKVAYPSGSVAADNSGKVKTACVMTGASLVILTAAAGFTGTTRIAFDIVNATLFMVAVVFSLYSWLFIYERRYRV